MYVTFACCVLNLSIVLSVFCSLIILSALVIVIVCGDLSLSSKWWVLKISIQCCSTLYWLGEFLFW